MSHTSLLRVLLTTVVLAFFLPTPAETLPEDYPARYAKAPRFNALVVYTTEAEEAHVQFDSLALQFLHKLTYGEGYTQTFTTDFGAYCSHLDDYDVLVWLNFAPTDSIQREAFRRYMENGGGWVGFHAAAYNDSRTRWPWFNQFLGCGVFLANQWPPQCALLECETRDHPVTRSLPAEFVAAPSEYYMWNPSPRLDPNVQVLVRVSERNYPFGIKDVVTHGDFPVVWTNTRYRMIYLNMGHGDEAFTSPATNLLFTNALRWVVSLSPHGNPFEK